MFHSCSEW
ncbi:hypothetical protein ID866_8124 [Astraeus odoratus]|nr:hypothetical protein ID866_8124 [Astraeus odoratus]